MVDTSSYVSRFYGMFNDILNVVDSKLHEITALHLTQTYCLPFLTYSCEIGSLRACDVKHVDVAIL